MKILFAVLVALSAMLTSAQAQQRDKNPNPLDREISLGELTPTPEMWLYQQDNKRHDDPKLAVRQRAEFHAAQRAMRLESQRWYGYSKARPLASPTPFTSVYSVGWVGNASDNLSWTPWTASYSASRARLARRFYYGRW